MEAEKQAMDVQSTDQSSKSLDVNNPLVIGAGALVLGFAIGSKRMDWLTRETGKIAASMGNMALGYIYDTFKQRNPQLFAKNPRIST